MNDIAPELLEKVQNAFAKDAEGIKEALDKGIMSYEEAYGAAFEIGSMLSEVFDTEISAEILPDGQMYYNIANRVVLPMLKEEYDLASQAAVQAQTAANKAAGIGIKAQAAEFDEERAKGIIDRVSSQPYDEVKWMLNEPVKSFAKNVVDKTLKKNVEFQGKSGLHPKIVRRASAGACEWCQEMAGTYEYPGVPDDVFRRHANCDCVVDYVNGGKIQDVWTKIEYRSQAERDAAIQERIARAQEGKTGNQKKAQRTPNKMAATSPNDWSQTTPREYSKAELRQIIAHINERGYKAHDIKEFDGDIALLDKQLDCLDQMQKELPIQPGKRITISVKNIDDEDFAVTDTRTITFNTKALRNEDITTRNILNNPNFAEKEFTDVARHEYGHVYEAGRERQFGLEVAKRAYYNIYNRYPSTQELEDVLKSEISNYATTTNMNVPCEIISETLCRNKNNPTMFSREIVKQMR